ncbi:hypothetical protein OG742_11400 [Streptomyces sp. NBC_00828]|uniref:hypothetical protein n=1 Tax=Streptomyces sp. NBC_00828 TaxID=2903678 RepID=UPI00386B4EAA
MAAPPQARPNPAQHAERDAKIYRLRIAGLTERAIAAEVELSQPRVHEIITEQVAEHLGPVSEEYADHREAELDALWRVAHREVIIAKSTADRLKAIETCRRVNESRRRLRGADAPEALEITHSANIELSSEVTVGAVMAALEHVSLPPDRRTAALEVAGAFLESTASGEPFTPPEPISSGITAAPYIDNGVMFIDGPGGLRYRVSAVENQPGSTVDRAALPPAERPADDADVVTEELDLIEAEFAEILEEVEDDDEPESDQAAAS